MDLTPDLTPNQDMRAAARDGLARHERGESGDGLKPETVRRANRIAAGEELTPEHVREMNAWFARHGTNRQEPGTPWYTAWQLWSGDAGRAWARRKVEAMEETKAVNFDQEASLLREAWYAQFPGDKPPKSWVETVFDNAVIVRENSDLYRVPYQRQEEQIVFAERNQWQPVRQVYLTEDGTEIKTTQSQFAGETMEDALAEAPITADDLAAERARLEAVLTPDELATAETLGLAPKAQGGAVKYLGEGRIGGYLILFSDESTPDLTGDYFTKDTDFGPHTTSLIFYQHAQDGTLKRRVLDDRATLRADEVGVWVEAQLKMRDDYEREIERMVKDGKLGWSSGTAPHLVERVRTGKAAWIKAWPLGLDASLTPNPAEPRTLALALKQIDSPPAAPAVAAAPSEPEEITAMGEEQPTQTTQTTQTGGDLAQLAESVKTLTATVTSVRTDLDELRSMPATRSAAQAVADMGGRVGGGLNALADEAGISRYAYMKSISRPGSPARADRYPEGVFGGFCKALFYAQTNINEARDARKALTEAYGADPESAAAKALGTQAGVSGTYMIPEQFVPMLMQIARQNDALYGRTMVIPADGGEIVIPALDHSGSWVDGQSNYYGGATVNWGDDDAAATETTPRFKQVRLKTNALKAKTRVKNSLLMRSAITIDAVVSQILGAVIGRARDYALMRGTGAGQPLGFLNAPATIDAGGSAIDFATLAGMEDDVIPERDENYVWAIHTKSRSSIYSLQQTNNTLVTFLPDLRGRPQAVLLGRPIVWTDKLPYLSGDVSNRVNLIDPSMIVCAEYQGIALAVSDQVRFEDDETVFRAILSMDAQPWLTSKIEIASSEYVSGFITL